MRCVVCGKGMLEGVSLYRQNPKGEEAVWACIVHLPEPAEVDPEVRDIVKTIEDSQ